MFRRFLTQKIDDFWEPLCHLRVQLITIEVINNKARHNLINVCKILSDGVPIGRWSCSQEFLGTPWSNESDAQQPELGRLHEICRLGAIFPYLYFLSLIIMQFALTEDLMYSASTKYKRYYVKGIALKLRKIYTTPSIVEARKNTL